jgi:ABC-type spermidine/putrescine transport system permease subunit I
MAVEGAAAADLGRATVWARAWETIGERDELRHLLLVLPALVFLTLLFVVPLAAMLKLSLFDPGPTFRHYLEVAANPAYRRVLAITFETAAIVTALCLLLGYPLAYLMATVSGGAANMLIILVIVPFWISVLVRTYAWMVMLGRQGLVNTLLLGVGLVDEPLRLMHNFVGVLVGMTHVLLPFAILPMFSVMKNIDRDLLKAAENLGANRWQAFRRVFLPLSLPGVAAGAALVFVAALGFFITPALLGGPRDVLIAMMIERQVNDLTNWGLGSAVAVVLLVLSGAALLVFRRFLGAVAWGRAVETK